jgi:hypothetical protein
MAPEARPWPMLETTRDVPLKPAVFLMATDQTGLARAMLPWPAALPLHVGESMNPGNDLPRSAEPGGPGFFNRTTSFVPDQFVPDQGEEIYH